MERLKRNFISFSKYLSVGIFVTILSTILSFLLIDMFGIRTLFASTFVGIIIFFIKYFSYINIKLIHRKFVTFMMISLSSVILYIVFSTILIDLLLIPTLLAIPFVIIILFLLRFLAFHWTKIIIN